MFERHEDVVERIVAHLRRPIAMDPAIDGRVMQRIAALPEHRPPRPLAAAWRWLARPRPLRVSPLAVLGAAAALALVAIGSDRHWLGAPTAGQEFQFVVVAPHAASVALVGDFNDWDPARTPMRPLRPDGGVWTALVPLSPGRYRYGFLVNGTQWLADPAAPAALDDEFGAPSSVVTVAGL